MSTALHLVKADPGWAKRLIVLEKAVHPREKLCGGGVTRLGEQILTGLGLSFAPSHVPIHEVRIVFQDRVFAIRDTPVFRVVHRAEFDSWLVQYGEQHEIVIRQGEAAKIVEPYDDYVEVVTEQTTFHAKTVVAADGSCSFIRKTLKLNQGLRKARTLEILTSEKEEQTEFHGGVAVFDFSQMLAGLQGYCWDFPSVINGRPFMNRGIFDSRIRSEHLRISLSQTFKHSLAKRERSLTEYQPKGFPIQQFDPRGNFSRPRILFAGDAAGVDPLFGEGISFALAYGQVAATAIVNAFARQDFSFADYKQHILTHPILRQLRARTKIARFIYITSRSPRFARGFWNLVPSVFQALMWYRPQYIPLNQPRLIRIA